MPWDRRDFLKGAAAVAGGAGIGAVLANLPCSAVASAAPASYAFDDYRALICVFLHGGNDGFNTIVPRDEAHYRDYRATRGDLALPQKGLIALDPLTDGLPGDRGAYGLHPAMPELAGLFNAGHAAIVANVGTLVRPVTRQAFIDGSAPLPPQLFSHVDQQVLWQSSPPDNNATVGWGGRIADLFDSANPKVHAERLEPTAISTAGQSIFLCGQSVDGYGMEAGGVASLQYLIREDNAAGLAAFNALRAESRLAHPFERTFARNLELAVKTNRLLDYALREVPAFDGFPGSNLASQLHTVARLIAARGALNMRRQIFFVAAGGYDTHDNQLETHAALLGDLSASLAAFQGALTRMRMQDAVTTFTASDFGRTLSGNGDGTDHGWGSHHIVLGGAVRGRRFYGRMPSLGRSQDNPDDAGYGQIIPTTSVEQYAATLTRWFGVRENHIDVIFPGLRNFNNRNLGFV